jgi:L-lysine epsilon oxidase-like protein
MAERQYRIHPAIGIARVGDAIRTDASNDFYFVGPEFPELSANVDPASGAVRDFKTADGRVKPQAARFRIFEYEKKADGKFHPIGEVKTSDAARAVKITWTVHLANRKASFCAFHGQAGADDTHKVGNKIEPFFFSTSYTNQAGQDLKARNFDVKALAERQKVLVLDGKPQTINGGDVATVRHFAIDHDLKKKKDNGETKLKIKTLGELRSDSDGRLIVLGGMGQSDVDLGLGSATIGDFANNDGWFDDVSDGPVDAELTIGNVKQEVVGAWVLVGPPDFAPAIHSYRTMFDTLADVIVREMSIPPEDGLFAGPYAHLAAMNADWTKNKTIKDKPSFTRDIAPILTAIVRMERVHQHQMGPRARYHGSIGLRNFAALGGQGSLLADREAVFDRVRDPNTFDRKPRPAMDPSRMPSAFGDYFEAVNNRGGKGDPAFLHSISKLQYALLAAWERGDFIEDWVQPVAAGFVPPGEPTPDELDRAALENISGGAFYPGMEVSWLFAKKEVWATPFRIARGKIVGSVPVPPASRADLVVEAGMFSQQMALPWQADFFDCTSDFVDDRSVAGEKRRIAWWPTNRPDDVFPLDTPTTRQPWARVTDPTQPSGFRKMASENEMVDLWSTLGFVVEASRADAPDDLYEVEYGKKKTGAPPAIELAPAVVAANTGAPGPGSG